MKIISWIKAQVSKWDTIIKQNQELLWAQTWKDTSRDIPWIKTLPGISPGRWAVGYNYIYVMTRILNEIEPHFVLDLGLGISSTLISNYFGYKKFTDGVHDIVEQDKAWADFYTQKHVLSNYSHIITLDAVSVEYKNCNVTIYNNFKHIEESKKFQVISIDGPKGSARYSRRDVLSIIPGSLAEDFVIVMDDAQRVGEKDTINEIKDVLNKHNIEYSVGFYLGETDCCIIASKKYSFLCSM